MCVFVDANELQHSAKHRFRNVSRNFTWHSSTVLPTAFAERGGRREGEREGGERGERGKREEREREEKRETKEREEETTETTETTEKKREEERRRETKRDETKKR